MGNFFLGDTKILAGQKGDPFTYEDFTKEQLDGLKGDKGDPAVVNMQYVTLLSSNWVLNSDNYYQQAVTVNGISSDETSQVINIAPIGDITNKQEAAGVMCIGQAENQLIFVAINDQPTTNIKLIAYWLDAVLQISI